MENGSGRVGGVRRPKTKDQRPKTKEKPATFTSRSPETSGRRLAATSNMNEITTFESRTGRVACTPEELYNFLTDIRNFERFVPKDRFGDMVIDKDTCTFSMSMMGEVKVKIGARREFSEVMFSGNAMHVNDFSLNAKFHAADQSHSEVKLTVLAHLNPFLRMLASEPVNKFLETVVSEMEKFDGWKEIRQDS